MPVICFQSMSPAAARAILWLMKPNTSRAMQRLLADIRHAMPFDAPLSQICQKICLGCPKKLLAYLESEVENWEIAIDHSEVPTLGDIEKLQRTSLKICTALENNKIT